eukprot:3620297-Amphidinium_carterae.1
MAPVICLHGAAKPAVQSLTTEQRLSETLRPTLNHCGAQTPSGLQYRWDICYVVLFGSCCHPAHQKGGLHSDSRCASPLTKLCDQRLFK